jgi:hypothetical protein
MGHIVGEQIGFKSIALVHMGVTLPFTHRQTQSAKEETGCKSATASTSNIEGFVGKFIFWNLLAQLCFSRILSLVADFARPNSILRLRGCVIRCHRNESGQAVGTKLGTDSAWSSCYFFHPHACMAL